MKRKILLILFLLILPKTSFADLWDENNPAISCLHIKQANPSASDWKYFIQSEQMTTAKEMYCDMTTAWWWWMLIFQRRVWNPWIVWERYKNTENCWENLNDFLHNPCWDLDYLYKFKYSYSSDVDETLAEHYFWEYLFLNYSYWWTLDSDDAYRLKTNKNIFPDDLWLRNIKVDWVCDINWDNCDMNDVYWRYAWTSWFDSANCNWGYNSSTTYKWDYGYCHNWLWAYQANSLFWNRKWYNEVKLRWHNNNAASYLERVFIKYQAPKPTDIELSNDTFDVNDNLPLNIWTLSTTSSANISWNYSYSFTWSNNDNSYFSISWNSLILNDKTKEFYNIKIRTIDDYWQFFEKNFLIKRTWFSLPWSYENPIISCQQLKNEHPDFWSAKYFLKNSSMSSPREVYCEQEIADGWWMLLFKRAGWTQNIESCWDKLNSFLHSPCWNVDNLAYWDSYSLDVDYAMDKIWWNKYLVIQKNSDWEISDDSYIIDSTNNLFPNTFWDLKNISYEQICDINWTNCDSTDWYWKYAWTSWFHSGYCNTTYANNTTYKWNYWYCHNGINSSYQANSLFWNRKWYYETKLWWHNNWAKNYSEFVYIKDSSDIVKPVISNHFPEENQIIPWKKSKIEINYYDNESGINTNSIELKLYKSDNSWNFNNGNNILPNHTNSGAITITNTWILANLSALNYGKYKYYFKIQDNIWNSSVIEKIFYMDYPSLKINKDSLDFWFIEKNNKKFSDSLNIEVKTIWAPFRLYLKNEENPKNWTYHFVNWDSFKWYWYSTWTSQDINTFTSSWVKIAEETKNLNTTWELRTYNYDLKLWELLKDLLPAWEYEWSIWFQIFFGY